MQAFIDTLSGIGTFRKSHEALLIGIVALFLVLIVTVIIIAQHRKHSRKRKFGSSDVLDKIGNKRYMRNLCDRRISFPEGQYVFSYIAFDAAEAEKRFNTEKVEALEIAAAQTVLSVAGDYFYTARIERGVFALCFKYDDINGANMMLTELLGNLNKSASGIFESSTVKFRAGLYRPKAKKEPFETILANSKLAYYRAIENDVDQCVCTAELLKTESFRNRLRENLNRSIDNGEFDMFLQPIYSIGEKKFVAAEALSRWNHPEEGFLTPGHYIGDMRRTGVIVKFDYYMLDKVCSTLASWKNTAYGDVKLSCNITRVTISTEDFIYHLNTVLGKYDFDRSLLMLEITEDAFIDNQALAYKNILECKKSGISIGIDDFGAGHTSFSDICDYPVDVIKVDRQLTLKTNTQRGNALIKGLVDLAHGLGMEVLCEGVETEIQKNSVVEDNCDYIQGYYYSYVLPINEAMENFNQ